MKHDAAHRKSRRLRPARGKRSSRRWDRGDDDSDEGGTDSGGRIGAHWYIISLSILVVVGLGFVNFAALPHVQQRPPAVPKLDLPSHQQRFLARGGVGEAGTAAPAAVDVRRAAEQTPDGGRALPMRPSALPVAPAARAEPAAAASQATAPKMHMDVSSESVAVQGGIISFDGTQWLTHNGGVDAKEVIFSAWIYLAEIPQFKFPDSSSSMKTIASTKVSGCKIGQTETYGWSLFVHEWDTTNRQLRLSWTDRLSACHELTSANVLVPFNSWAKVGFSLSFRKNRARLFLNGQIVADTEAGMGAFQTQGQTLPAKDADIASRMVAEVSPLVIGAHAQLKGDQSFSGTHAFMGSLGDMWLAQGSIDDAIQELAVVMGGPSTRTHHHELRTTFALALRSDGGLGLLRSHTASPTVEKVLKVTAWEEHPSAATALAVGGATAGAIDSEPPPGDVPEADPVPPLSDDDLRKTWPAEWTEKWSEEELLHSQREADSWAHEVREAMRHTWNGYRAKAWGHDDIKPSTGTPKDWCRMAITMLDGLSTLWLMDLKEDFAQAAQWIEEQKMPRPGQHGRHSFFEITIRALGGLASAWSLSGQQVFADTAKRLADNMMHAYDTPNGFPMSSIDVGNGDAKWVSWTKNAVLAEVGTLQIEYHTISQITGDERYGKAADKSMQSVLTAAAGKGLIPLMLARDGQPRFVGRKISMGAMGDSYYEYLLKHWLQTGKTKTHLKDMWKRAMQEMLDQLVFKTAGGLTYIAEMDGSVRHRMDHLACFTTGMLMLGARTLPPEEVDPRWESVAAELAETCYQMYHRSPSGLSAEYYQFDLHGNTGNDMKIPKDAPHNLLRPEAIEALYYMHYYTGDPKWRRKAYEMWSAFPKHCKTRFGFSAVADVSKSPPRLKDSQESFWLAETLKYFYLIFAPRSTFSMEEYVLSTEAQPVKIWK